MRLHPALWIAATFAVLMLGGCGSTDGARTETPPTSEAPLASEAPSDLEALYWERQEEARSSFTEADVHFMTGMIGHHAQAIVMAEMVPTHGARDDLQLLARKIDISQRDEIDFMVKWLDERGFEAPDDDAHGAHGDHHAMMPGMLTPEQMAQLDAARGLEFERLFLTFMIEHHAGALVMVDELFASPGAAQDSEIFRFATDVDFDQRAEIFTMQGMLDMLDPTPPGSPSR